MQIKFKNIQFLIKPFGLFILTAGLICIFWILLFEPVSMGDSGAYITLAKRISDTDIFSVDFGDRSPLYTVVLSFFMKIGNENSFPKLVLTFQFILIFFSSLFIYQIVNTITGNIRYSFLIGFLYIINISTINFGYLILTETITLFLFVAGTWLIIYYYKKPDNIILIVTGLVFALLVLARFNTLFLPAFIIIGIIFFNYRMKSQCYVFKLIFKEIFLFSIPVLVVLSTYSYYNYIKKDYFFIFSLEKTGTLISRNGIYASIDRNTIVPEKYSIYKNMVLEAQKDFYYNNTSSQRKASLIKLLPSNKYLVYNNGFGIRNISLQKFANYFKNSNDIINNQEIKEFENQVVKNNRFDILKIRFFSLLTGLRASCSTLINKNSNTNLNKLPSFIFFLYKIIVPILTLIGYMNVLVILHRFMIKHLQKINSNCIFLILLTLYFPIVNFIFGLTNDANRFKFPSEPFIILFAMLGLGSIYKHIKQKWNLNTK